MSIGRCFALPMDIFAVIRYNQYRRMRMGADMNFEKNKTEKIDFLSKRWERRKK